MKATMLVLFFMLVHLSMWVFAVDIDDPSVKVRIVNFDPQTNEYTISCDVPAYTPDNRVDQRRFWATDPIPQDHNRSYYSTSRTHKWILNAENYTELVHTKAMYHLYCEVQNYSALPGKQNMASEVHVDLRTEPNVDVPNVYVLSSEGTRMTMKCDPPHGVRNFGISWILRSRAGSISYPELSNQRIVNITLLKPGSGWDIVCSVFDRDTGRTSQWDMPIEAFASGPAYVPTYEGCFPNEPCLYVHPSGIPPNGSLRLNTMPETSVYINEVLYGITQDEEFVIDDIIPGIYNLVLRKPGYEEISTLVSIRSGVTLNKTYTLQVPVPSQPPACHSTMFSLPANCTGGTIVSDTGTGCRVITCSNETNTLKVQACNKPGNSNPQYFELSRQQQIGSNIKICLGNICMQNEGFIRSPDFPICTNPQNSSGNSTQNMTQNTTQNISFSSLSPSSQDIVKDTHESQTFTYTLNNPEGLITSTQWFLDSILVSTATSYTFSSSQQGEYNISVHVNSSRNNLFHQWWFNVRESQQTCANKIAELTPTCPSGTISQDTVGGGCRTIQCSIGSNSVKVVSCEKTDSMGKFFEMYRQSSSGVQPQVCLSDSCLKPGWGYQKGAYFPICNGNSTNSTSPGSNNTNPPLNTTNSSNSTNSTQTCHSTVKNIPSTCHGGTFIQNTTSGNCRTLICSMEANSMKVMACDKPDIGTKQFFEMYRQSVTGTPLRVCIGSTCIQHNGYAKSPLYPICS